MQPDGYDEATLIVAYNTQCVCT